MHLTPERVLAGRRRRVGALIVAFFRRFEGDGLRQIMAVDDRRARFADTFDLGDGLQIQIAVPDVLRHDLGIQIFSYRRRIGGEGREASRHA